MNLNLPQVSRVDRKSGVAVWLPFLAAVDELEDKHPDVDRRQLEQSLFNGAPMVAPGVVYVPETILFDLAMRGVEHRILALPEDVHDVQDFLEAIGAIEFSRPRAGSIPTAEKGGVTE